MSTEAKEDYTITCVSGTVVLVRAKSTQEANEEWDEAVERGDAEPRISETTERASRTDIQRCVVLGHDYR